MINNYSKHYKPLILLLILLFTGFKDDKPICFIGLNKEEVLKNLNERFKDFHEYSDIKIIKQSYNYLKYQTNNNKLLMIFFDEQNKCTTTQQVNNYDYYQESLDSLNKYYTKIITDQRWAYSYNNSPIQVNIKKSDWFFTIITKTEKK